MTITTPWAFQIIAALKTVAIGTIFHFAVPWPVAPGAGITFLGEQTGYFRCQITMITPYPSISCFSISKQEFLLEEAYDDNH